MATTSPIYRYGRPIEIAVSEAPESWIAEGGSQASWESYLRYDIEHPFAMDQEFGIANTDQYQVMSITFCYDPFHGAYIDVPF